MKYYVDTCIWLNLFKKEGNPRKGKPWWKIAETFVRRKNKEITYSCTIIRELQLKLEIKRYQKAKWFIEKGFKIKKIEILQEDENNARKLESKYGFSISFYDLVHLSISKRMNLILITRDKKLLKVAKENDVEAGKPEHYL